MAENNNIEETTTAETEETVETVEGTVEDTVEDTQPETEASAEDAETEGEEVTEEGGIKGLFKRKKDKRDIQIEELTDKVQRQMAEFDNFRKRTEKEKAAMFEIGAKSVVEKILPTIDNFERGFSVLTEEQKAEPFAEGMEKVYRQMLAALEAMGVTPIEAVGKEFDPNFHNAVMHVEDDTVGENIVVEEFQKGYLYHDNVVRHSMVKVAN